MSLKSRIYICLWCLINFFRWLYEISVMSLTKNVTHQISQQQLDYDTDSEDDYCEFDSTWEDENKTVRKKKKTLRKFSSRSVYAARDMHEFRHSCKNLDDVDERENPRTTNWGVSNMEDREEPFYNLEFYKGSRTSEPDDVLIHQFHKEWWGKYAKLERVHSYIQWLFPIQEQGMNWQAYVLTKQEIKLFREDNIAKQNLVKSYELMLDFYGIRLDKETGDVARAVNWKERFDNMNRNTHNNLRITRILKCLGILGFEHYQEKLVKFFLHETLVEKRLPNVKKSVLDYFMFAVLDKSQRQDLVRFAFMNFSPRKDFVWGPKKILSAGGIKHEMTNETRIPASKATEENRTLEEESSRMQKGSMMPSSTTINTAEDRIRQDRIRQEPKPIMLDTENESITSGINTTLDKEYSRTQEEGVTPDYPTSHTAKDTGRDRNRQELVLDHAANEATKSGKITLDGEPIRKQETGEMLSTLTSNPAGDAREGSEQNVKSSHCATEMEDITAEQSDTKDQMQGMQKTVSDMTVQQTSNESDEISQGRKEDHQVGSDSAEGGEKNGYDHVKRGTQV